MVAVACFRTEFLYQETSKASLYTRQGEGACLTAGLLLDKLNKLGDISHDGSTVGRTCTQLDWLQLADEYVRS